MPSIAPLATFTPPCNSRTWLTTPHPHLPIVATACSDKTVRIYSLQNFQQQSTISGGHKRSIRSCAWKPNSLGESVLATGSFDATAGIWKRWEQGAGPGNAGAEIDFTSGLAGGKVDEDEEDDEWRFAVVLEGHDSEIKSLAFSTTSPLLATCSRDKSVWIWEELEEDNEYETVAVLTDHEGDVKCVAWHPGEQLLASASYDDNVRLWREDVDDWACCSLLSGHGGTVWWVEFEAEEQVGKVNGGSATSEEQKALVEKREKAGPRLLSCSDDHTIRVWRRIPKDKTDSSGQRLPSIWKNTGFEEEWVKETRLPAVHERSVYAVSWSKKTGRVASTGSDGKIVVYEERWRGSEANGDMTMADGDVVADGQRPAQAETEWVILADIDSAHDVFEVNHITWAARADKDKRYDGEEVLISTGDDGEVKVWTFDP
jgi:cytosolic iron-sulfur protein assembly protein CIAO1